jgi:hypothetical protein
MPLRLDTFGTSCVYSSIEQRFALRLEIIDDRSRVDDCAGSRQLRNHR